MQEPLPLEPGLSSTASRSSRECAPGLGGMGNREKKPYNCSSCALILASSKVPQGRRGQLGRRDPKRGPQLRQRACGRHKRIVVNYGNQIYCLQTEGGAAELQSRPAGWAVSSLGRSDRPEGVRDKARCSLPALSPSPPPHNLSSHP